MATYKSKDEFLDALFDHAFPEGTDVDDDDQAWFEHIAKFFDSEGESNAPRRRRQNPDGGGNGKGSPRRRRSGKSDDSYGSSRWFGS